MPHTDAGIASPLAANATPTACPHRRLPARRGDAGCSTRVPLAPGMNVTVGIRTGECGVVEILPGPIPKRGVTANRPAGIASATRRTLRQCLRIAAGALFAWAGIAPVWADDYTWIPRTPAEEEQRLMPVDPAICRLYEENLRYFARQNTPMSCYRPIAPHLADRIQEVAWEDLDPDRYPVLFRAIAASPLSFRHGEATEENIQGRINGEKERVRRGISVFRRALVPLTGLARHDPSGGRVSEPYWIIQFGINDQSPNNSDSLFRCTERRAGTGRMMALGSNLKLMMASAKLDEYFGDMSDLVHPSNEGQYLRRIDGRLFVENMLEDGWISLNEIDTTDVFMDTVCAFQFTKTSRGSRSLKSS